MSERKGSLQLVNNSSLKFFNPLSSQHEKYNQRESIKIHKYRGSLGTDENNLHAFSKTVRPDQQFIKKESTPNMLLERNRNLPEKNTGLSTYRNSLEESLLSKLRKLGYVSNGNSKQSSPIKKKRSSQAMSSNMNVMNIVNNNKKGSPSIEQVFKLERYSFNKGLFDYKHVIGKGGFGKVWKVELKRNKKIYAMKEMSKALIIAKKSVPSVISEKKFLASLKHNFLVNMVQSFQDRETLYLVMDYLPGGDLRHHIGKKKRFTEEEAKFIISCILLGLDYLHHKNIIHRDIKPENLVLDEKGYVRITDLGVARTCRLNNSSDTSGTPGYMAPEVLCRQNHTYSVDHFAMGIIAYELMLRKRPYYGRNRKEIRDEILAKQVQIKKNEIPDNWSMESADFINRLIQRKPASRLGFSNSTEIRNHPWLRQYPFERLEKKEFTAPFIPANMSYENKEQFLANESEENTETKELIMQNEMLLRDPQVQELFEGYESMQP